MDTFFTTIRDWRFIPGVTPFTAWPYPTFAVLLYVILVRVLPPLLTNKKPFEFPTLLYYHNLFLSVTSNFLAIALFLLLIQKHSNESITLHQMICSKEMHEDGRLHFIYTINHILKYVELFDTIYLTLRKKTIPFLHTYHHAATLILTWSQLVEHSTVQWVPILLNLVVHVFMYYYYAVATKGVSPWWKKYLTTGQILQFVIDMVVIGYAYGTYLLSGFRGCYGTDRGAVTGIIVLFSYLVLFVRFYAQTYKGKGRKQKNMGNREKKEL